VSSIKNIPKDKLSDALKSIIKGQASNNPEILSVLVQLARDGKKDWWKLSTDYKVIKNMNYLTMI